MAWRSDIRFIVGLDFGTTYSGFSFCQAGDDDNEIYKNTNVKWPKVSGGYFKTNTALQYDDDFEKVELWGRPALHSYKNKEARPVELFKLYLGNCLEKYRPTLPVPYKQAITDYLRKLGELIKTTIAERHSDIDFKKNVLLVLTIPAEYAGSDIATMRECAFNAGLIDDKISEKLQFTTEPEAAAIYCMHCSLIECGLTDLGTTFMIVDCGGGTVDLTTRKLLGENQLGEVTERAGDFQGSTFIDKRFIKLLKRKVGSSAVKLFRDNHCGQMQCVIQEFCQEVKLLFTGDDPDFNWDLELDELAPELIQYVTGKDRETLEEKEWTIKLDFNTIKSMFDPSVDRIIEMISAQLSNSEKEKCSAIFLVGGFSESIYLQKAIKKKFHQQVENITVPTHPIAAVVRGATLYGKNLKEAENWKDKSHSKHVIMTRILNHTFGVQLSPEWEYGDPLDRMTSGGRIRKFRRIVKRGTDTAFDQEFTVKGVDGDVSALYPIYSDQEKIDFKIFYTKEDDGIYCDEPGMKLLGELRIDLPDVHLGTDRPVTLNLSFGGMEVKANAYNRTNGQNYRTRFEMGDI